MRKKKRLPSASKLDRLSQDELVNLLEAMMMRNGELFRGLFHKEIEQEWVLEQMLGCVETQVAAIHALQRKAVILQSV